MKKLFTSIFGGVLLLAGACTQKESGDAIIRLPEDYQEKTLVVSHISIESTVNAKSADDVTIAFDTLEVKNGVARLILSDEGPTWYNIYPPVMTRMQPEFYAVPGDHLEVEIRDFDPLDYVVKGSPLMEDVTAYLAATQPLQLAYFNMISENDSIDPEKARKMLTDYDEAVKKFVAEHPDSHAVAMAIQDLGADDFKEIYDNMSPEAKKSILMPYAEIYNREVEDMMKERDEEQARKKEVASGTITAPDFTLPDLAGKKVSLSDFRGKWVVLDFWGSWCGWCVKGFPALKKAYEEYGNKIVVIGIDCNESEADWKEGVKKHSLPWINLYNGNDHSLYEAYNIQGFPTKAIINPEGKLVDLTTGEDPAFFDRLAEFVK